MTTTLTEVQSVLLNDLGIYVCDHFSLPRSSLKDKNLRGRTKLARHVFTLVATDAEVRKTDVARWLGMAPSFITQTRNRQYKLRTTQNYQTIAKWFDREIRGDNYAKAR